jgi:hypothetical protein
MDPYLEAPAIWHGFHHLLADEIIAQLNTVLSPRYYADVEVRTVLEEVGVATTKTVYPDAAILETVLATSSSATAVAIPAAPIQRLAMLPEEHKLRTVQVRETPLTPWSPPLKFSRRSTSTEMVSTYTAPNAKAAYGLTCISSSWICSAVASDRGGKSRSPR